MEDIETRLSRVKRCPELRQAFPVISEGIKRGQQDRAVPISFHITAPRTSSPSSRHIVPRTTNSRRHRCVRKTATFPSGTPRVPSSALLFDLEVPFLCLSFFSIFSLHSSRTPCTRPRLYFSLSHSLAHLARRMSLLFFLLILSPRDPRLSTWRRRSAEGISITLDLKHA